VKRFSPRGRQGAVGALLFLALVGGGVLSCNTCPDSPVESCHTLAEWQSTYCTNLADPPAGEQCPSAEAFAKTCSSKPPGRSRVNGGKCCYDVEVPCL
jgi:hypothetical protein